MVGNNRKMSSSIKKMDRNPVADETARAADAPPLPAEAQDRIGRHLQQIYGQLLSEPMPDKFAKLLSDLAKSETDKEPEPKE